MADRAHRWTDLEVLKMKRHINSIYAKAHKDVSSVLSKYADTIQNRSNELFAAVESAETQKEQRLAKAAYKRFYLQAINSSEFKTVSHRVSDRLYYANAQASRYINTNLSKIYVENYNYVGRDIAKKAVGYTLHPASIEDVEDVGDITMQDIDRKKDTRWNEQNLKRSILAGAIMLYGASKIFSSAADSVVKKNKDSAYMHASDMATDAENKGRMDSMSRAEDEGYAMKKIWLAAHDNKTRDTHQEYDSMPSMPLDYEYNSGLKRPRDPNCSIMEEVCNCRCCLGWDVGQKKGETRAAREGEVKGSYKNPNSFAGTKTIFTPNMTYREWMKWRSQ